MNIFVISLTYRINTYIKKKKYKTMKQFKNKFKLYYLAEVKFQLNDWKLAEILECQINLLIDCFRQIIRAINQILLLCCLGIIS